MHAPVPAIAAVALATALAIVGAALGAQAHAARLGSSSLAIDEVLRLDFTPTNCPPNTLEAVICGEFVSHRLPVRGLGTVAVTLDVQIDRSDPAKQCSIWTFGGSLGVERRGAFSLTGSSEGCQPYADDGPGPRILFTVNGGEGRFAGASGGGVLVLTYTRATTPAHLAGTLTVAGFEFDLTAPRISAKSKTVTAPRGARAVPVRYAVSAHDDVDGRVPAACRPPTGSRFRIGRTKVTCTARDSSANAATASFTVTVRRRRA